MKQEIINQLNQLAKENELFSLCFYERSYFVGFFSLIAS